MNQPDPEQLDRDVRRYLELDEMRTQIETEQGVIKERLRANGPGAWHAPCGVAVSVTPNRRFNADKAAEVVPPALLEQIQSTVVDAKKAKAVLPPAIYDLATVEVGQPRVVIR